MKINWDMTYDTLSTWKKWNVLLEELKLNKWIDIVNYLRHIWKTPKVVAKILRYNPQKNFISSKKIFKEKNNW